MTFSAIIPLYNKAPYVRKAVESVLAQTFTDFELMVVDDGSTDGSAEVIADIKDPRIRIIRQENAGVSTARNNGVAATTGEYICFLDADDWWAPTFLVEMKGMIERFPEAGIYGTSYTIVNETKCKTRIAPIGVDMHFTEGYINYCQVYAQTLCMPLTSISVAIPRQVFLSTTGFNPQLKLGEDFDLWIRIALKHKVAFLNKPLAYYNQDVDISKRGTNHLHDPRHHMLWNLGYLENEEQRNSDYKQLIDNLRTYSLMPYFLSRKYRQTAMQELAKVDWTQQNKHTIRLYHAPIPVLFLRFHILRWGASLKKHLYFVKTPFTL